MFMKYMYKCSMWAEYVDTVYDGPGIWITNKLISSFGVFFKS